MENINLNNELPKADDFFMLGADARDLEHIKKHKEVLNNRCNAYEFINFDKDMKQTAVEFLVGELKKYDSAGLKDQSNYVIEMPTHILTELEEQAKEMEEQQQGYSEEEVYDILIHHTVELFKKEPTTLEDFWNKFKKK